MNLLKPLYNTSYAARNLAPKLSSPILNNASNVAAAPTPSILNTLGTVAALTQKIATLTLSLTAIVATGWIGWNIYKAYTYKKRIYPNPTNNDWKKIQQTALSNKQKIEKVGNEKIPGRPEATKAINQWCKNLTRTDEYVPDPGDPNNTTGLGFYGPTGTGKTYLAEDILAKTGHKTIKLSRDNISDFINIESKLFNIFEDAKKDKLKGERPAIYLDEVDQHSMHDNQFQDFFSACAKWRIPVIVTTNNPHQIPSRQRRRISNQKFVSLENPNYATKKGKQNSMEILRHALGKQDIQLTDDQLDKILEKSIDKDFPGYKKDLCELISVTALYHIAIQLKQYDYKNNFENALNKAANNTNKEVSDPVKLRDTSGSYMKYKNVWDNTPSHPAAAAA